MNNKDQPTFYIVLVFVFCGVHFKFVIRAWSICAGSVIEILEVWDERKYW